MLSEGKLANPTRTFLPGADLWQAARLGRLFADLTNRRACEVRWTRGKPAANAEAAQEIRDAVKCGMFDKKTGAYQLHCPPLKR